MTKWIVRFVALLGVVVFTLYLARIAQENEGFRNIVLEYNYFGVFFVSLISGFNLVVPIPAVSFLPLFLESGLSFWLIIFVMTIGMTTADIVAYVVGAVGRDASKSVFRSEFTKRLDALREQYYWTPIIILFFYATFAPLPNELIVIPLGFMRYRLRDILLPLFLGSALFNIAVAYGILGLFSIL